jgi:hypothetical protein
MQCSNNLKQIGLSLLNYESANKKLPPGDGIEIPVTRGEIPQASSHAYILPYLEAGNSYSTFDFSYQVNGNNRNSQARIQVIPSYNCPSDPAPNRSIVAGIIDAGATNYMQCLGATSMQWPTAATPNHGIFYRNSFTRIGSITDGMSNTAFFSEIRKGPNGPGSLAVVAAGTTTFWSRLCPYVNLALHQLGFTEDCNTTEACLLRPTTRTPCHQTQNFEIVFSPVRRLDIWQHGATTRAE